MKSSNGSESVDLFFGLKRRRDDKMKLQHQAIHRDRRSGCKTMFVVPEGHADVSENVPYLCKVGEVLHASEDGKFKIVEATPLQRIPEIGETLQTEFRLSDRQDGGGKQWQDRQLRGDERIRYLFVPEDSDTDRVAPANMVSKPAHVAKWEVQIASLAHRSQDGRFRIYKVRLVKQTVSARAIRRQQRKSGNITPVEKAA